MDINELMITRGGRLKVSTKHPLYESKHISSALDPRFESRVWSAIINHGAVTGAGFGVGNLFKGSTSGLLGIITGKTASSLTYNTTGTGVANNNNFVDGETITDQTNGSTATITNHNTGAHHYYDYNTSSVRLAVGTLQGQRVVRQSTRYIPYFSGFEPEIEQTFKCDPKTGVSFRVFFGDDLNGCGVWIDGLTPKIFIRSNTSGSPVDSTIPESAWLDGQGTDWSKAHISRGIFKWLGYDRYTLDLVIDGNLTRIIKKDHAGFVTDPYMRTPTLPVRWEIENTANTASPTELREVCANVSSEGGAEIPGDEYSASLPLRNKRAVTGVNMVPLMAVRLKNEFPTGKQNRRTVKFKDCEFTAQTNNATIFIFHAHDPITITGGSWVDTYMENSGVEYNIGITDFTAMHLHLIQTIDVLSGQAGKGGQAGVEVNILNNHSFLSQNYESNNSQCFVAFGLVEDLLQTANISGHMTIDVIE